MTNNPTPPQSNIPAFKKYFSFEEAVNLLPTIKEELKTAQGELREAKDNIILFKRMLHIAKKGGKTPTTEEISLLKVKYSIFEQVFKKWLTHFDNKGVQIKDFEAGLLDFPYYSKSLNQDL